MPIPRLEQIPYRVRRHGAGSRFFAEWCFLRAVLGHFGLRFLVMFTALGTGAMLFMWLEPDQHHTFWRAVHYTFSLIFGEPLEALPSNPVLASLFFIMPILGLTVIIEGIIDFTLMLRDRRRYERRWCTMLASSFKNHVIIVGAGRLGFRSFGVLRRLGEAVVVIERDADNQFLEEVRQDGSPLLIGDARRESLLEDANVEEAKCIVLATNDDMANLETALDARRLNPEIRVVLRMFDQAMADKVRDGFNIHLAMSPSAISALIFATCAIAPATMNSFVVGDQIVASQRWLVREAGPLNGRTIAEVMADLRVGIVSYQRPGEPCEICPAADVILRAGDGVVIQGPVERLEALRREFMIPQIVDDREVDVGRMTTSA